MRVPSTSCASTLGCGQRCSTNSWAPCTRRAADGLDVFSDIREALRVVYEDAERVGLFEPRALRRVYGEAFERDAVEAKRAEWTDRLDRLYAALGGRDADGVEAELTRLSELNRSFSLLAAERYLDLLREPATP